MNLKTASIIDLNDNAEVLREYLADSTITATQDERLDAKQRLRLITAELTYRAERRLASGMTHTDERVTVDPALIARRKREKELRNPTYDPTVPQVYDFDEYRWITLLPAIYVAYVWNEEHKDWTLLAFINLKRPGARLTGRRMRNLRKRFEQRKATREFMRDKPQIKYVELFTAQREAHELLTVQAALAH